MPFISIQSFYKRVAAALTETAWRITNWIYNDIENTTEGELFGFPAISDDGQYLVVSGPSSSTIPGVVRVYHRAGGPGTAWEMQQELVPTGQVLDPSRPLGYEYGWKHIAISGDGTRIAIGCYEGNTLTNDQGAVYIFRRDGGSPVWVQEQKIVCTEPAYSFNPITFNTGTDVNSSTNLITLDAPHNIDEGWVEIVRYKKNGGSVDIGLIDNNLYWAGAASTTAITIFSDDFGPNVTGPYDGVNGNYYPGHITLFGGTWYRSILENISPAVGPPDGTYWEVVTDMIDITAAGSENHAIEEVLRNVEYSYAQPTTVCLDYTGNTLAFAEFVPTGSRPITSVWTRSGTTWTQQQNIEVRCSIDVTTDRTETHPGTVAISNDGNTIAVGIWDDVLTPTIKEIGIYTRSGSTWSLEGYAAEPTSPTTVRTDWFGIAGLSLSADGSIMAVGEPFSVTLQNSNEAGSFDQGAVYIYERTASPGWGMREAVTPRPTLDTQFFGWSCALSPDGTKLAVGAPFWGDGYPGANNPVIRYSTNGSGEVATVEVLQEYEPNFADSGTFTITTASDPGLTGTPAVIQYTSTDGLLDAVSIVSPGSGYTPNVAVDFVASSDLPRPSRDRFWPPIPGDTSPTGLSAASGNGRGFIYVDSGSGFVKSQQDSLIDQRSSPTSGYKVDITADGKTIVVDATEQDYRANTRATGIDVGSCFVFEEVTSPIVPTQTRHYSDFMTAPIIGEGFIPPTLLPSNTEYGLLHKISADGNTMVITGASYESIEIWYGTNGEDWVHGDTITPAGVEYFTALDISNDGTKIVFAAVTSLTEPRTSSIYTYVRSGSPLAWAPQSGTAPIAPSLANRNTQFSDKQGMCLSGDGNRLFVKGMEYYSYLTFNTTTGVNSSTDVITFSTNHNLTTGDGIRYYKSGSGVSIGINDGFVFYARVISANQVTLHPSAFQATNNTGIYQLTSTGGATHRFVKNDTRAFVWAYVWNAGTESWDDDVTNSSTVSNEMYEVNTYLGGGVNFPYSKQGLPFPYFVEFGDSISTNIDGTLVAVTRGTTKIAGQSEVLRYLKLFERVSNSWVEMLDMINGPVNLPTLSGTWPYSSSYSTAMSSDGNTIVAYDAVGHVYILERNEFTTGAYVWTKVILSDYPQQNVGFASNNDYRPQSVSLAQHKVIALSKDGNVLAIGRWGTTSTETGVDTKTYIYRKVNNTWRQEQIIATPCADANDFFGRTLSLNQTGSLLTVATKQSAGPGKVNVYSTTPPSSSPGCPVGADETHVDTFVLQRTFSPSTSVADIRMGFDVAINELADRVIIGGATTNVYRLDGGQWVFEQELIPTANPDLSTRITERYGLAVDINDAGDIAVVSSPFTSNGEAYVFTRSGTSWTHSSTLSPSGTNITDVRFGADVSINPAGNVIVVGTDDRFQGAGTPRGIARAYLFRNVVGTWNGIRVDPLIVDNSNGLSGAVDYVDNGTDKGIMAVGVANVTDNVNSIYFYEHVYGAPDTLTLTYTFTTPYDQPTFGTSKNLVKFSRDKGKYVIIGNPWHDPAATFETVGSAVVLKNSATLGIDTDPSGPWTQVAEIVPPNLGQLPVTIPNNASFPWIEFGASVKISSNGERLMISSANFSYPDVTNTTDCLLYFGGSAWMFEKGVGETWTPMADGRLFPVNPNGEYLGGYVFDDDYGAGAMDTTDDMTTVVIGGSRAVHATLTSGDVDLDKVGQARIYTFEPTSAEPYYDYYTNVQLVEDSQLSGGDFYGEGSHDISNDGNTIAAAYAYGSTTFMDIYVKAGSPAWTLQQRIDTGYVIDIISLSDDGNKLVFSDDTGINFVTMTRSGNVWTVVDVLTPSVTSYEDFILSGDGNTLFILDWSTAIVHIVAYVWNTGTSSWDLQDDTTMGGDSVLDYFQTGQPEIFGNGIAASSNGDWVATVGIRYSDRADGSDKQSPCAYIWKRTAGTWALHSIVAAMWYTQASAWGSSMSICMSSDGTKFAMANADANKTWVFSRSTDNDSHWDLDAILAYDVASSKAGEYWALDMSDTGDVVVVGQYSANPDAVVVWRKVDGQWRQEQVLYRPDDPSLGNYFGYSLHCDGTGSTITISDNLSVNDSSEFGGLVWVFSRV